MSKPFQQNIMNKSIRQIIRYGSQNYKQILNTRIKPQKKIQQQQLKPIIKCLKHTAYHNGLISLSANQINFNKRIFVILKKNYIRFNKWTNYYQDHFLKLNKKPQQIYDTIINPQIMSHSVFKVKADEECPSLEGLKFKVWAPFFNKMRFFRYLEEYQRQNKDNNSINTNKIPLKSKNINQKIFPFCQQQFNGFYSRVFDHQFRHLQGILSIQQDICHDEVYLTEQYKSNPQNYQFLKDYKLERQYFSQENMEKNFYQKANENMPTKEELQKMKANANFDFQKISDRISPEMKEKFTKSYKKVKEFIQRKPMLNKDKKQTIQKAQKIQNTKPINKQNILMNKPSKLTERQQAINLKKNQIKKNKIKLQ